MPHSEHFGNKRSSFGIRPILTSAALATVGLIVALVATWPTAGSQLDTPGRRLALNLPNWLTAAVALALFALFLAIVANIFLSLHRRDPEDLTPEPPPVSFLSSIAAALILAAPILVGVAAGTRVLWQSDWRTLYLASVVREDVDTPAARDALLVPAADLALTLGLALLSLIAISFALWLLTQNQWPLRRRLERLLRPPGIGLVDELSSAVAAGIDDLSTISDPRMAAIACYQCCERAIGRQHPLRNQWQTPREYIHGALSALPLPAQSVASLMAVFEQARFGNQSVTHADRNTALAALGAIRAALEEELRDGSRR